MDNENIRPQDAYFQDILLPPAEEHDADMEWNHVIEKSLQSYEEEKRIRIEREREENRKRAQERMRQQAEIVRTENLKEELGIVLSRLRMMRSFSDRGIVDDLFAWVEWQCTPSHLLTEYSPSLTHSRSVIIDWARKNLNPLFFEKLEKGVFF